MNVQPLAITLKRHKQLFYLHGMIWFWASEGKISQFLQLFTKQLSLSRNKVDLEILKANSKQQTANQNEFPIMG